MVELGYGSQYSDWAAGWTIRELWFNTQHEHEIFQFSKMSRLNSGAQAGSYSSTRGAFHNRKAAGA
jgi:hypothetical protein